MSVDVRLINPFVQGTLSALKIYTGLEPKRTGVRLKQGTQLRGDISGIMGLSGEVNGSIVISFLEKTACRICGRMVGETYDAICPAVVDGIQELVNVVAGQAKAELEHTRYFFKVTIPTCIIGRDHVVQHQKDAPTIVAEFELEGEPFTLEVTLIVGTRKD